MFSCVGAPTSVKEVRLDVSRKRITFNPVPVASLSFSFASLVKGIIIISHDEMIKHRYDPSYHERVDADVN